MGSWRFRRIVQRTTVTIVCILLVIFLVLGSYVLSLLHGNIWFQERRVIHLLPKSFATSLPPCYIRAHKFVAVPLIAWGLNNQKIAFARACLTARFLNRTLLMPTLSASLFYKELDLLEPIPFDKVFQYEKFNSLCDGFVRLGHHSETLNQTDPFILRKGSGRKWSIQRDLDQLTQSKMDPFDAAEVFHIAGKNPFLWHDHWPVADYARVFQCLVFVDSIQNEAAKVISKIRGIGINAGNRKNDATKLELSGFSSQYAPYVAVHMRIEKDWMIHCKKLEQKRNIDQICSSKSQIIERVANINGLVRPIVVYIAVADSLLEDDTILSGWGEGLIPLEKKKLGVWDTYKEYPYLIQSAIDYVVCSRADVFVGNSFSTFSSLIVLERTLKLIELESSSCTMDLTFASFAYNVLGEVGRTQRWVTDLTAPNLVSLSYGTSNISSRVEVPKQLHVCRGTN